MAICTYCEQEMLEADGCSLAVVDYPDGGSLPSIPYSDYSSGRCHNCNVLPGQYHHPGCDMEICPRCGGQLISCGCLDDEDEDED